MDEKERNALLEAYSKSVEARMNTVLKHMQAGVKFVDFLANFRISVGKRMLATGNYKVAEVAEAAGFSDQKYFQKVFKKICGISPAEYKKENSR